MKKQRHDLEGLIFNRAGTAARALTVDDFSGKKGEFTRTYNVRAVDVESRTVELSFSSEAEVERWFGVEILDHDPASVRLDRMRAGAALLVNHDWNDQVGVVETVSIDADRRGRAVVRFGNSARAEEIFQDVKDGIRKLVSVGYRVNRAVLAEERENVDVYRVTDWEPFEISLVSVPADYGVGVGRSAENPHKEGDPAKTQNPATQAANPALKTRSEAHPRMLKKKVRDKAGNLVLAMVDENDNIVEILELLEAAATPEQTAQRAATAATEAERSRTRSIMEMGEQYGCEDLARDFVRDNKSADDFARAALERMNGREQKPVNTPSSLVGMSEREIQDYSFLRVVRALQPNATRADREAAKFEIEVGEQAARNYGKTAQGIIIPDDVLVRNFNAGNNGQTTGASGGKLIANHLLSGSFIDMLTNRTTIMQLAAVMTGLVGTADIPKQISGSTGYWVGEDEDAGEGNPEIGQISLSPKTVAAFTDITRRLLMQATPSAEGLVRADLARALAQQIDQKGYYGTGTDKTPKGITHYDGVNTVELAGTYATYAELVDMETEISADNADVNSMAYVLNSRARGDAKTQKRFPSSGSDSVIWEAGNTVNGYRAEVTNQIATGDYILGNFADLIVGLWGGLDLTVDPYTKSKSGGLRLVVFQDVDFVLRREESFCVGRKAS